MVLPYKQFVINYKKIAKTEIKRSNSRENFVSNTTPRAYVKFENS
jgi:hypothetical protein